MARDRFLFIINPIAGGVDKSKYVKTLDQLFFEKKKEFDVFETTGESDDFQNALQMIEDFQPDVVVAVGGDGTCNMVAKLIYGREVLFGIVPLGSANGLARELNIGENRHSATETLFNGIEKSVDALLINNEHICLHLSDIGLNAKVVKRFEEERIRGMFGYMKQFVREIKLSEPKKFRFELKGNSFKKKAHMVVIANAGRYGTGAIVNPVGKIDDGKFEICIIKPFPLYAFLTITFHLFRGTLKTSRYVDIISCRHIKIINLPREVLQIDGEVHGYPEEVEVTIKKHAYKLIVPQADR
ncbi:diacylglycerol/lipid kinase family protein [Catalinimonas niigatensis]|uniref:diacylglycerol/lipid kinase family protein n=1 Tax=Catalinimonas niigatensis TaxID=1397264 RepID=UPI00266609AE|nr:diacylglycerol kinase family protein [Catalinimonas niigatensis]WPP52048.1 diacylglycerol kinase family protein [Catalinimonas niigatensis]